jgi:hypothetical protein
MSDQSMSRASYEADVCRRLSQAEHIPFQRVSTEGWVLKVGRCHENADAWAKNNPGSVAIRGWVTYYGNIVAAHSVVQDSDGQLFDITPLEDEATHESTRMNMRFIRHVGVDEVFFEIERKGRLITCPGRGPAAR